MTGQTLGAPPAGMSRSALLRDYLTLTKPRITLMVVMTALGGWWAAARAWGDPLALGAMLLGTALTAAGASALNMVIERRTDGQMRRTERRPLPAGRLQPGEAKLFGWAISALGLLLLGLFCPWGAAAVAFVTWASYLFVYTPLKPLTSISTLVGAVPGALPPLIGMAAARESSLPWLGWVLFAIMFLWQVPHFLAIAVLYREDYARGNFPMLPVIDGTGGAEPGAGNATARQMLIATLALIPVSLLPVLRDPGARVYFWGALLAGLGMLAAVIAYARTRELSAARRVMRVSLLYLPIIFILLMASGSRPVLQ